MPASLTYPGVYIEEIPSGVRTIVGVSTSMTAFVGPGSRTGGGEHEAARQREGRGGGQRAGDTDDDGLAATVEEVLLDGERHPARLPQTSEDPVEVPEVVDAHRLVVRALPGSADERGHRGADSDDGPDPARDLLDVDTRIGEAGRHGLLPFLWHGIAADHDPEWTTVSRTSGAPTFGR